jgi:RNA polymerase sigma-70 factor (ECF subfamily)
VVSDISNMGTEWSDPRAVTASVRVGTRPEESDAALMRRVQGNDPGALEELYERHSTRALSEALAICQDPDRAEDAVQEAFVGVWRARFGYQPALGSFADWAMSIVRHRARDAAAS